MYKKSATEIILDLLQRGTETSVSILHAMATHKHEAARRLGNIAMGGGIKFKEDWSDLYVKRRRFYSLLNKLKSEGLIKNEKRGSESVWSITSSGKLRLYNQKRRLPRLDIKKQNNTKNKLIIVSYDIPESKKRERAWLRENLKILGFEMIHKSVWFGKTVIPEEFLVLLKKKN